MKEIVTIFDPTIDVNKYGEMKIEDAAITQDSNDNYARKIGRYAPFVDINGRLFMEEDIISLSISVGQGLLPSINLTIRDNAKLLSSYSNLTDVVDKVFIRSQNKEFKPIRQNYHITSAYYSEYSTGREYTMSGVLFIEGLHSDVVKSWGRLSSYDLCQCIAKDLELGFASNETTTNDEMCRICPNVTLTEFIKTDLETSIYKDDDSFFKLFIDQYYYLNLVEVNQMLSCKLDIKQLTDTLSLVEEHHYDGEIQQPQLQEFILGNLPELAHGHCYFESYSTNSSMGSGSNNRQYAQYYDNNAKQYKEYYLSPLVSKDLTENHMTTASLDPAVQSINFGEQYADNVHANYYAAKLLNSLNLSNTFSFTIDLTLTDVNPMLYCYMSVPIIVEEKDNTRLDNTESTTANNKLVLDRHVTGMYVITGMTYNYDNAGMTHSITAAKREFERQTSKID